MSTIKSKLVAAATGLLIVSSVSIGGVAPASAITLPDHDNKTFNPNACIDPRLTKRIINGVWYAYVWLGEYANGCRVYSRQAIGPVR